MAERFYAAPVEGLTTWLWRRVHHEVFGGADKYFTPFVSPNANLSFQRKELRELEGNEGLNVVPQILAGRADHFCWAAGAIRDMGYSEVNLNLGCPSGTVTAKNKGAGLLQDPDRLDALLDGIFSGLPEGLGLSVKTRIGWRDDGEWPALVKVFSRYPIRELIVHPRIRSDFYTGRARREVFSATAGLTQLPLVYNGDVATPSDAASWTVPVMAGRGLLTDPALFRRAGGGPPAERGELRRYHDALAEGYEEALGGGPALHRMWELWAFFAGSFEGADPWVKKMRKCRGLADYRPLADAVLTGCPLRGEE